VEVATTKKAPKKLGGKAERERTSAPVGKVEARQSTNMVRSALVELGLGKEELKAKMWDVLSSICAKNYAMASFFDESSLLLKFITRVMANHGEIINEVTGLSLVYRRHFVKFMSKLIPHAAETAVDAVGLWFLKLKNDTKSRLGNAPVHKGPQKHYKKFQDRETRPHSEGGSNIPDKQPIGTNLGDKMRAAGITTETGEAPVPETEKH
jgi:hypothetical protein